MFTNWKKNTSIFLASQAISLFGSSLVQFAITAYITIQTKSGLYATAAILCAILPSFVMSPFAGVWADKFSRKTLILIADGGIALCTLIAAVVFLLGHGSIWLLYVILAVRAFGNAVQMPCVGAMLPDIVPEQHLARVNGINGSLNSLFMLASPMLGAALMQAVNLGAIFFVDIITAAVAIVILLTAFMIPKKAEQEEKPGQNYFHEMKLGLKYIKNEQYLRQFFAFCIVFFFAMAPAAFLTQIQVVRNYTDNPWGLSAIEVAFSAGMLAGGLLITIWGGFKNRVHTMVMASSAMAVCTIALGIRSPFVMYVGYMGLFGIAMPLMNNPAMTMLQEKVSPVYIGRVFSVMTMLNSGMMPLGMVVFGPLADFVDIEILLLITGVVIMAMALLMLRSRALVEAGYTRPQVIEEESGGDMCADVNNV